MRFLFFFLFPTSHILTYSSVYEQSVEFYEDFFVSLAFDVCKNTVLQSKQTLFHVVDFNCNPAVPSLVKLLHESSIQTVLINDPRKLTNSKFSGHRSNLIFFLNNLGELLSLILNFGTRQDKFKNSQQKIILDKLNPEKVSNFSRYNRGVKNNDCELFDVLPRYCIRFDGIPMEPELRGACDETIDIISDDLWDTSILPDSVYHMTRGLYENKIWNSKNHLIFMIHKYQRDYPNAAPNSLPTERFQKFVDFQNTTFCNLGENTGADQKFHFKFFWRFFRGLKTVICSLEGCEKYDPFTEQIASYKGGKNESYFDFSWSNMHEKPISLLSDVVGGEVAIENYRVWPYFLNILDEVLDDFQKSVNCTSVNSSRDIAEYNDTFLREDTEFDIGHRFGAGLHVINFGKLYKKIDWSAFDYSVTIESLTLCIATPHSKHVPQYLVIFKAFTPVVWAFILITISVFVHMQYAFQLSQRQIFQHLYTETEIRTYEGTSSLLTVFSYFICGHPPRLLLGQYHTGKVLFTIFSFSALIISTVFLNGMTTLLSSQVRYPEIDTLKEFEEAGISLQMPNTNVSLDFLSQDKKYDALGRKITRTLQFITRSVVMEMEENKELDDFYTEPKSDKLNLTGEVEMDKYMSEILRNVAAILEADAVLESIPEGVRAKKRVKLGRFLHEDPIEYHLVAECLMSYPVFFPILKNSFLFEKLNAMLARFLEAGLTQKTFKKVTNYEFNDTASSAAEEPRPYNLYDLQPAFIILLIGLFSSILVFVAEITEVSKNHSILKYIKRIKLFFH
ncbi:unnamed protein product [Bemisia tabaci]|uniref:Ionotropic receptor n=1 Tax=Bemisia tabaci TaxID=7038 RepID=A0A9P0AH91_BEMTA|nr:unnamed protein product [Bemisia tabaci]